MNCPLLQLYYLIGNIIYFKLRSNVRNVLQLTAVLYEHFKCFKRSIIPVPLEVLDVLLKQHPQLHINNCLIMFGEKTELCWYTIDFFSDGRAFTRVVMCLKSPVIPTQCIICSEVFMFNIKQSLSLPPWTLYDLRLRMTPINNINLNIAKALKIRQVVQVDEQFNESSLDKVFAIYLKQNHYVHFNDLVTINSNSNFLGGACNVSHVKIVGATINDENLCNYDPLGFLIGPETSVFKEGDVQSFVPSSRYSPVIPSSLQKHQDKLLSWFKPFFLDVVSDLRPLFVLSGAKGVGKSLLVRSVSQRLGVHVGRIDCNVLIGATSAQTQAYFKTAFHKMNKSSPIIVEFYNAHLLLGEAEGVDSELLVDGVAAAGGGLVAIVCVESDTSVGQSLRSSVLGWHHVALPSEAERRAALAWACRRLNSPIEGSIVVSLAQATSSYTVADLYRLVALASRHASPIPHLSHFTPLLKKLSKVEPSGVGSVEWADVGGVEEVRRAVVSSVEGVGGLRRTGLLLHGPPGTGKTLLARAVASQLSASFIPVKGPELLNMYVGQSEANIRRVFQKAREAAPSILFFDELDSLAPNRGNKSDGGGVMDRVVSQLLAEMDGLEANDDVFILAATNRPDLIDAALLRPGRLDKMLYIGPCSDLASKLKVFHAVTRKFVLEEGFDATAVVKALPSEVTGAQVYAVCYEAWMNAAKDLIASSDSSPQKTVLVKQSHFEHIFNQTSTAY